MYKSIVLNLLFYLKIVEKYINYSPLSSFCFNGNVTVFNLIIFNVLKKRT